MLHIFGKLGISTFPGFCKGTQIGCTSLNSGILAFKTELIQTLTGGTSKNPTTLNFVLKSFIYHLETF